MRVSPLLPALLLGATAGVAALAASRSAAPGPTAPTAAAVPAAFERYVVCLLVRPAEPTEYPAEKLAELQAAHLAHLGALGTAGRLRFAGPFEDHSGRNVRGMLVLRTGDVAQAREWVEADPAVRGGRLVPEYMVWFVEKGSLDRPAPPIP